MELENNFLLEKFNPDVLREYDIRGIVNKDLTENTAYTLPLFLDLDMKLYKLNADS